MGIGIVSFICTEPSLMISVIIPAHNESAVISRTLAGMTKDARPGELEIIVVCNGCTDNTAAVARHFGPPVRVLETAVAGKARALNLAETVASGFPRVYADADVVIDIGTIRALAQRLERGDVMAVAPTASFDLSGCSWAVRSCYSIRALLPSAQEGIGGSGVYALSATGRRRFDKFPILTADDGYIRIQFQPDERATLASVHSTVYPPRTIHKLIATKTRSHYGSFELAREFPERWKRRGESNNRTLLRLFRDPRLWPKLAVYSTVAIISKSRAKKRLRSTVPAWERDDSSRAAAQV
jgi:glycosyltransferase involved in cell wall biosynthesis